MPLFDNHRNFAYTTVATAPSPATTGTSLVVATGTGGAMPSTPFNATVWPSGAQPTGTNAEIIRVTNIVADTLTISRGQEGSVSRTIVAGDQIAATITVKTITDLESASSGSASFMADSNMKRVTVTDANVTTSSKITLTLRRPDITEENDPGWIYITNIVNIADGSFDVSLVALEWDSPAVDMMPNETITLFYHLWN